MNNNLVERDEISRLEEMNNSLELVVEELMDDLQREKERWREQQVSHSHQLEIFELKKEKEMNQLAFEFQIKLAEKDSEIANARMEGMEKIISLHEKNCALEIELADIRAELNCFLAM